MTSSDLEPVSWRSRISRLWDALTRPPDFVTQPEDRRRIKLLAVLLCYYAVLCIAVAIILLLNGDQPGSIITPAIYAAVAIIIYSALRTPYWRIAINAFIIGMMVLSPISLLLTDLSALLFAVIGFQIVMPFISRRASLIYAALLIMYGIIALILTAGDPNYAVVARTSVAVFIVIGTLHILYVSSARDSDANRIAAQNKLLAVTEAEQRALLAALPDLMLRIDHDGTYVDFHAGNVGDLVVPPQSLIGKKVTDVLPPHVAELYFKTAKVVLETGQIGGYEYELDVLDGHQHYEARLVRVGENGVLSIIRNITGRKQLEEQLRQAEIRRLELAFERERRLILEQFIQDASHDLRTPITALSTTSFLNAKYIELLRGQVTALHNTLKAAPVDPGLHTTIDELHQTVERLTDRQRNMAQFTERLRQLIESMFDMVRLDAQEELMRLPTEVEPLIEDVVFMLEPEAERRRISLHYERVRLPLIRLDSDLFHRAMLNLIANGIGYTNEDGSVTVRTEQRQSELIIEIADTGIGIAPEHLPNIFKRFYRTDSARSLQSGGSGLGLSIAQRIVELHGGRIEVESELDKGSTFRVLLPC